MMMDGLLVGEVVVCTGIDKKVSRIRCVFQGYLRGYLRCDKAVLETLIDPYIQCTTTMYT